MKLLDIKHIYTYVFTYVYAHPFYCTKYNIMSINDSDHCRHHFIIIIIINISKAIYIYYHIFGVPKKENEGFEQGFARVPMDLAAGGKSLVQPQEAAIDR